MANFNPLVPGDVPYPQYSVTTTEEIDILTVITKGVIYTKNATGELIVSGGNLERGIFQARETPVILTPAVVGEKVQVLGPRTRMLLENVGGDLVTGDLVENVANTSNVILAPDTTDVEFIGRVFEIYTKDIVTGSKKKVAGSGDLVIVETVGP